jgi:putative methyltransferase (TIGR04325 family)
MRKTLRIFLPPIIYTLGIRLYRTLKNNKQRNNLSGYANPILVGNVIQKTVLANQNMQAEKRIYLDAIRVFLPFALARHQIKSVLELGGGAGYHYFNAMAAGLVNETSWTIFESPEFCRQAKTYPELNKLRFIDNLLTIPVRTLEEIDLIYCSRALQYFDNPVELLRQILLIKPKYVYLTGITYSPDSEIHEFTQKSELSSNGPQVVKINAGEISVDYKLKLLPESLVEKEFDENYSIELRINEEPVVHIYRGIEIPYRGIWAVRKDLL